ncbi:cysteine hydrolase family protein [Duganella qianjiadongensis]|uniref:Isochorismatase family protein n=1 Tax=Duganella qianjiadongensis TaxID=2692176 RepID=A0ABW9VIJ4_9BURK|nr:cysteine hydrolase family protein [Duganella qianjiadongensis]MYM39441.1 isochorismatase family protein [Duganella qianjiadongensis]
MTTLLIIDMQVGMTWPKAEVRNNHNAEETIARLLMEWRHRKAPVVHVRHISRTPGSPFWPGQPGVEFQPALSPLACEHVVEKNVPDAFINTGLERWLHTRGESSIIIVGVSTNNSVESTARTAGNLGFKTFVVSDGTYAYAKTDFNSKERSAEDIHAMALANLDGEYASIISSVDALEVVLPLALSTQAPIG